MDDEIRTNIASPETWLRLLFIVAFAIVANILIWLVWIIAGVQFLCSLITGKTNGNLDDFSAGLVTYLTSIFEYMVYRTDTKPFPFTSWDETQQKYAATSTKPATSKKRTAKKAVAEEAETE